MDTVVLNVDLSALPDSHTYILGPSGELGKKLPEGTFTVVITGYGALKIATKASTNIPPGSPDWPAGQVSINDGSPKSYQWVSRDQPTSLNISIHHDSPSSGVSFSAAFSSTLLSNSFSNGSLLPFSVQDITALKSVDVRSLRLDIQTGHSSAGSWLDGPGTDAKVLARIGTDGKDTGWIELDNWGDDFQAGQWDRYNLPPKGLKMNELRNFYLQVTIPTSLSIFNDAWNVGRVKITANDIIIYDKAVDQWLNSIGHFSPFQDSITDYIDLDGTSLWMRYDKCCFICTHNAFAAEDSGWWIAQQKYSIKRQLELGVRALMLDVWPYPYPATSSSEAYLCHELDQWQGKAVDYFMKPFSTYKSLADELADIKSFMDKNKAAVITLILESYTSRQLLQRAFSSVTGLNDLIFWADRLNAGHDVAVSGWPTLAWMVEKQKRLVVFTSRPSDGFPRVWNYAVENNYGTSSLDTSKWVDNRRESSNLSSTDKTLCILNHFPDLSLRAITWSTIPTAGVPVLQNYFQNKINDSKSIAAHVEDLQVRYNRTPNFIAVDFFELGNDGGVEEVCRSVNKDTRNEHHPAGRAFHLLSIDEELPKVPFDVTEYPLRPVQVESGKQWAQEVLGQNAWSPSVQNGGNFNPTMRCMEAVEDPYVRGLWGVICDGPPNAMGLTSYICVGGPAAKYVDVAVYPSSFGKVRHHKYLGWNGESFRDGAAISTGGYYWYRYAGHWVAPFADPNAVFYAKTYRHPNDGSDKSFKLWAFMHEEDIGPSTDIILNTPGPHHKRIQPTGEFIVDGNQLGVGTWQTDSRFLVFVSAWGGRWWVGELVEGGMKTTTTADKNDIWTVHPDDFEAFSG